MTDGLITWLRAQLDEDERVALWAKRQREEDGSSWWWDSPDPTSGAENLISRHNPARVLAEVEAKRALIEETIRPFLNVGETTMSRVAWLSLRLVALPYADRPGYLDEWRP